MRLAAAILLLAWYGSLSTVQCANPASTWEELNHDVMQESFNRPERTDTIKKCWQNNGRCLGPKKQDKCKSPNVFSDKYHCRSKWRKCCIDVATTQAPVATTQAPTTTTQAPATVCVDEHEWCSFIQPEFCADPKRGARCQKTCRLGPCAVAATKAPVATTQAPVATTQAPDLYLPTASPNYTIGDRYVHWAPLNPWTQEQKEAYELLKELDGEAADWCHKNTEANWNYVTDLTEENRKIKSELGLTTAKWEIEAFNKMNTYKDQWKGFPDENLKRQFKKWSTLGSAALDTKDLKKIGDLGSSLQEIYSTGTACDFHNSSRCDLKLNPDLEKILAESSNYEELTHVWKSWRDASGKKMRKKYKCYVKLKNKVAKLNGFKNMAEWWRDSYEDDNLKEDVTRLWDQVKPLYEQLHAYVRRKLGKEYGEDNVDPEGPIPAHLFGNMWSQNWDKKFPLFEPYPGKQSIDVTEEMIKQNYTAKRMFELSDEFFTSLNLYPMPKEFWDKSVIERPFDKDMVCHASAWEFCNHKDFGIKQCTNIGMSDLLTVHHEMGHIQYYLQYSHQPKWYRTGANAGFHEAIGDTMALSVATPKHLHKIGLLKVLENDEEADINFLMMTALQKVALLPFAFLMDNWRWDVFSGDVKEENWNCHWWKYRTKYQGIKPPVKRSENDFDPGAKSHIPSNTPYIRYFIALITQFQFHKALCLKANEYDPNDPSKPLHQCDIYKSHEAGAALKEMLQMGASKPWPEALEKVTGTDRMDASVIREYFKPLEDWLKKDNAANNVTIGWHLGRDDEYCSKDDGDCGSEGGSCS